MIHDSMCPYRESVTRPEECESCEFARQVRRHSAEIVRLYIRRPMRSLSLAELVTAVETGTLEPGPPAELA